MKTRRKSARRLEEKTTYAGAPAHGDQAPPHDEDANMEHTPLNPPPLTDDNIKTTLL